MSHKRSLYSRGDLWLDFERRNGEPVSTSLYIFWYDPQTGKVRRKSTRRSDVRLASQALDEHYLATSDPTAHDKLAYSVQDAMADYWLEAGQHRSSAEAIKARLKLISRFFEAEIQEGRLRDPIMPADLNDALLGRFRRWAVKVDQIATRKRGPDGEWTFSYRPRSPATAEESVISLKAALKHNEKRLSHVPLLKHKVRDAVTPERAFRLSTGNLAEMLDFTAKGAGNYAGHSDRLLPLRRYLIGAISTVARPDAIFDMSVQTSREQWLRHHDIYALNPRGRVQTKKVRPVVPVTSILSDWLEATDEWFVCREWDIEGPGCALEARQRRVASVDSAWATVCQKLGVPPGWGPKLIRHSVATILAAKRVDPVELEILLGHRPLKKTTGRYAIFHPDYLLTVREAIEALWSELKQLCQYPLHPSFTQEQRRERRAKARRKPVSK